MIEFLTNPYVIIFIVVSVIVSNIMLLKYTAKLGMKNIKPKSKKDQATDDKDKQEVKK